MTTKEWFNLFVVQILEKNYYTINMGTKHLILKRLHNVFFLIPQQRHQFPQIKLKLIVDESVSMRMVTYAVLRWGSQSVVVWTPSFIDVIKSVWDPLLLEHSVPLLTDVERLASPATQTKTACYVIQSDQAFLCTSSLTYCGKDNSIILLYVVCILDRKNNSELEITVSIKIVRLCNISTVIITKPGGTLVSMLELQENTWHIQARLT